jgi:DNA polymerase-3 subunit gamma/tau
MSDSQVIARKFRPQTFDQVVGQEAIRRTIENSIKSGRIHHAYLFAGARGVGKTTTARILAKALNCVNGPTVEPCGVCPSCVEISASRSIDVMEIDAASNTGVDNVRDVIINTIQISPARDRYKIFIIDEVHMLSNAAFNALLKTLEEPPPRVVFIMATTELHKVPETILSRCQVFEFRTISLKKIVAQLRYVADQEGVQISDAALLAIARAGDGSMRDAESALDQVISFAGNKISDSDVSDALGLVDMETLNATMRAVSEQDSSQLLRIVDEIVGRGYDLRNFSRELMAHIRALLVVKVAGFDTELVQMAASEGEEVTRLAQQFSEQDLIRFFTILTKTEQDIRTSPQPRFQIEIGLMKLLQAGRLHLLEDALNQIADITTKLGGAGISSSGVTGKGGAMPSGGAVPFPRAGEKKPSSFSSLNNVIAESRPAANRSAERSAKPPATTSRVSDALTASPISSVAATPVAPVEPKPAPPMKSIDETGMPPSPSDTKASSPAPVKSVTPPAPQPVTKKAAQPSPPWEDEPPPAFDAPYDYEPELPPVAQNTKTVHGDFKPMLVNELEARRRMILANTIARADSVTIDGDTLRIAFSQENARDKREVEATDKRRTIEEICRALVQRSLKISVTVGTNADGNTQPKSEMSLQAENEAKVKNHPAVKAITDRFQGQVFDIARKET